MSEPKLSKYITWFLYGYLTLPICIFLVGWLKWYLWLPGLLAVGYGLYRMSRQGFALECPAFTKKSWYRLAVLAVLLCLLVITAGIGRLVWQNSDQAYRNTIFQVLVKDAWPVTSDAFTETNRGFIYYIGFWLPAALVGKAFGMQAGYLFQILWALLGLLAVFFLLCILQKKVSFWPMAVFLFFSGLDVVGVFCLDRGLFSTNWLVAQLEWWPLYKYQYSSMLTQLFWVFNQAIPAWVITLLLLAQKDNRQVVYIVSLALLHCTFPFIGMIPIVLVLVAGRALPALRKGGEELKAYARELFTFQNVVAGGFIGIVSFLYLVGNLAGNQVGSISDQVNRTGNEVPALRMALVFLLFVLLEVGVYLLAVAKYQYRNRWFWVILLLFLVIPNIKVGTSKDFCMRASIPALVILILLILDTLRQAWKKRDRLTVALLCGLLLLGAVTPLTEILRTGQGTYQAAVTGDAMTEEAEEKNIYIGPNFAGETEGNFFFTWMAR